MKINRKGFMLAEVVVVSVIVCVCLVSLATGIARVSKAYDTRNRYYDVNALYMAEKANLFLIREGKINTLIEAGTPTLLFTATYQKNDSGEEIVIDPENDELAKIVKYYIHFENDATLKLYFSKYTNSDDNKNLLKSISGTNQTFKDFVDYLSGHLDFGNGYTYMLIPEICNSKNDCYYYGLGVK